MSVSVVGKDYAFITRYIRNLRGGSQPILAQASDGVFYVVKFINNLQGPNLLFNEGIGSELYRACGLAVPAWKPLLITDAFIDQNQDCWMQTPEGRPIRPTSGLCFGSRFLGGDDIRLLEILPGTSFKRVRNHMDFWLAWLIDICAGHADNRQALFLEGAGGMDAFFVDYGHFFGGPKGELKPHFQASRYLDSRIYQDVSSNQLLNCQRVVQCLDMEQFWHRIQTLPDVWKTESAVKGVTECLNRLSTSSFLKDILDTMVDAIQKANESKNGKWQFRRKPPETVLYAGVQTAGGEYRYVAKGRGFVDCAQE